ncbi:hypothetical protein GCM10023114_32580 [Mycolicibacterium sediminis]|uniref:Uncharacterized protein n=1 Tax=Mycolicibacterium sediminis TaxID=1286180 RepID=A0A7I7R0Q9_9MYCO|nr:hypothetical protein MSEDJ_57860 [Mycolicibacterium sediminis]
MNLHYSECGHRLTQKYFRPIAQHYRGALEGVLDADLEVAKRVLETLVEAARPLPGWDAQGTT